MSRSLADTTQPPVDEELRFGTLLFADIAGSTGIVAGMDDESARDTIGATIETAAACIAEFGGRVNRITGDGIMAMFGAPDGLAEHALAACAAAIELHARVRRIALRIGIHTGEFMMHPLRAAGISALDASGVAVHFAARVQQAAEPGETLIGETTLAAAGARLSAEPLPPISLRGFETPANLFRLRGADLGFTRFEDANAPRSGFVNREAELAMLASALRAACEGRGGAVLVLGEAGIGKTRLAREIAAAAPPGMRVFSARALRWRREAALHPFAQLVGPADGDAPAVAALRGEDPMDAAWRALKPSERRAETIAAARDWLLAHAAEGPAAIVLDDLHWADEATIAALDGTLQALADKPVLLVLMARPEHPLGVAFEAQPTLRLDPLGAAEAAALAREHGSSDADADMIATRSGGNPFFIEQAAALGGGLPQHVRGLLTERVDRLPPEARNVLRMLAVIEQPVAPALLHAAMARDMEPAVVEAHLAVLDHAGFLHRDGIGDRARVAPKHALLQEAVYRGLTQRRRRERHALIARLPDADADMVARHAWLGALWPEALESNEAAARRALARFAHREAVVLLDRALDALDHLPSSAETTTRAIDLRLLVREPLFRLGHNDALRPRLAEAVALAESIGDGPRLAQARIFESHHTWLVGDYDAALAAIRAADALAVASADEALALRVRFQRGLWALAVGRHAECAAEMAAVAAHADDPRHGGRFGLDAPLTIVAMGYQARSLADLGDLDTARAVVAACNTRAAEVAEPFANICAGLAETHVLTATGDPEGALVLVEQVLTQCGKLETDLMRVTALTMKAAALIALGRAAETRPVVEEGIRLAEAMPFRIWLPTLKSMIT
jgi:class 3 adenylate cyclase/tetratricopeptide (TPR) repeat protein